ncbi:hypothetical protein DMENIID0001_074700 [Sergentomyia squamirostris]
MQSISPAPVAHETSHVPPEQLLQIPEPMAPIKGQPKIIITVFSLETPCKYFGGLAFTPQTITFFPVFTYSTLLARNTITSIEYFQL